jgi:phage I-like protein
MNRDVQTDGGGKPRVTPEMFVDKALAQGRLHPGERGYWLNALREHPDQAGEQLLKRQPVRALADPQSGRQQPVTEDAYLNYARATGVLAMRDDPRVGPSWAR